MTTEPSAEHACEGIKPRIRWMLAGGEFASVPLSASCDCFECGSTMSTAAKFDGFDEGEIGGPVCVDCATLLVAAEVEGGD